MKIKHPDEDFLIVRRCYKAMCFDCQPAAKLLTALVYLCNPQHEEQEQENEVEVSEGQADVRISKSQAELVESMIDEVTDKTLHDVATPLLQLLGFIDIEVTAKGIDYILHLNYFLQALALYIPKKKEQPQLEKFLIQHLQLEIFLIDWKTEKVLNAIRKISNKDKKNFLLLLEKVLNANRNTSNIQRGRKPRLEQASKDNSDPPKNLEEKKEVIEKEKDIGVSASASTPTSSFSETENNSQEGDDNDHQHLSTVPGYPDLPTPAPIGNHADSVEDGSDTPTQETLTHGTDLSAADVTPHPSGNSALDLSQPQVAITEDTQEGRDTGRGVIQQVAGSGNILLFPEKRQELPVPVQASIYETQTEWKAVREAYVEQIRLKWRAMDKAEKQGYVNWQAFHKLHIDAWNKANPKPKPSEEEDAFFKRCGELQGKINEWRKRPLKGDGEKANEWNFVQKLVKEYDDPNFERIEQTRNYLFNEDYRYKGPRKHKIGAYDIYTEMEPTLQFLAEREQESKSNGNGKRTPYDGKPAYNGKTRTEPYDMSAYSDPELLQAQNERNRERRKQRIIEKVRAGELPEGQTLEEVAELLHMDIPTLLGGKQPQWIH